MSKTSSSPKRIQARVVKHLPLGLLVETEEQIGHRPGQNPEYSLRLAESEPWDNLPKILDKNQIYEGIVTGVVTHGAFIEMASGLTGLLRKSQLPAWVNTTPIEMFWPGDQARVTIRQTNPAPSDSQCGTRHAQTQTEKNRLAHASY